VSAVFDPVHVAQRTFRALLAALAHPCREVTIDEELGAPSELGPALAAAALTLLDRDTAVWLDPARIAARAWLAARTGCRFVTAREQAQFGIILEAETLSPLARWPAGTAEDPEDSATLLVRVRDFDGTFEVALTGPGIESEASLGSVSLTRRFWTEWMDNVSRYPLGVDCFLFTSTGVVGLPRTTRVAPA